MSHHFCMTSFLRRCTANLTFLILQWSFFTYMITTGSRNYQITQNWNKKKPLRRSKDLSENLSLKLLRDAILTSMPGHSDIRCFKMSNFQSDDYHWLPNFSHHIKFKLKTLIRSKDLLQNLSLKFLWDVIFLSFPDQWDFLFIRIANF